LNAGKMAIIKPNSDFKNVIKSKEQLDFIIIIFLIFFSSKFNPNNLHSIRQLFNSQEKNVFFFQVLE